MKKFYLVFATLLFSLNAYANDDSIQNIAKSRKYYSQAFTEWKQYPYTIEDDFAFPYVAKTYKTITFNGGIYRWVGRKIKFSTVNNKKKNGFVQLSKNCKMVPSTLIKIKKGVWTVGKYQTFKHEDGTKLRCKVQKIVIK